MSVLVLTSCSTLRDSLIIGAGTGAVVGGVASGQFQGDRSENAIKGAVIGGVVGGLASYFIHSALESRDTRVRKEMLLNLEKFDVLGRDNLDTNGGENSGRGSKCYTSREVDGRQVSIPCRYIEDTGSSEDIKQ